MNLASEGGDPSSGVYFVDFNQDCTSLAVGLKNGFKIFQLNEVDKYEPTLESTEGEDICIVERLFSSSLLVVVSLSSPRRLRICHYKRGGDICSHNYSNTILSLKLNRVRIIVCLEESLYIHDIKTMKMLHTIRDTPPNPRGLCALSADEHHCYLAYPGSSTIGEVQVFDAANLKAKIMIPAHNNPLAAMTFNFEGAMIATASIKGTVIRVFCVTTGEKLFEFRRGMKRCVDICSLSFSLKSDFLCASSNTETVHIFKLLEESSDEKIAEEPEGWMGVFSKVLNTSRNYLPAQVTEMLNQERSFATVHLPFSGLKNICALTMIQKIPRVVVASADGYLYIYNLNTEEGGACTLARQHRLDGHKESHSEATIQSVSTGLGAVKISSVTNCSVPQISPQSSDEKLCNSPKLSVHPGSFSLEEQEEKVPITNVSSSSPSSLFRLQDDNEFPPVTHKAE